MQPPDSLLTIIITTYHSVLNDEIGHYSPAATVVGSGSGSPSITGAAGTAAQRIDPSSILYASCAIRVFNRDYQTVINGKGSNLSQNQL